MEKHLPSSKQKFSPSVMKSDNVCWLATARISSSIEIGPAQVLAVKAGLAIPWNKLRLVRQYDIIMQCNKGNSLIFRWLKSLGIHLAGEDRMLALGCVTGYQVIRVIRIFAITYPFE